MKPSRNMFWYSVFWMWYGAELACYCFVVGQWEWGVVNLACFFGQLFYAYRNATYGREVQ
jgi:hypothetical protein